MKRRDVIAGGVLMMASARFVAGEAQQRLKTLQCVSAGVNRDSQGALAERV
jgi:hypothetical protein